MTSVGVMASAVVTGSCIDVLQEPFNYLSTAWTIAGTPTIVAGRTGTACQTTGSLNRLDYMIPAIQQDLTMTVGFAFRITDAITPQRDICQFRSNTSGTIQNKLTLDTTGAVNFTRGTTVLASSAAGVIVANTWYYLEMQGFVSDTVGTGKVRINGTTVITFTGNTNQAGVSGFIYDALRLGNNVASTTHQYDDLYISTGSGCSFQGDHAITGPCNAVLQEPFNSFTVAPWTLTGAPTIVAGRTGTAAQVTSGSTAATYSIPSTAESDTITVGAAVRWGTIPTATEASGLLELMSDTAATVHVSIRLRVNGSLVVQLGTTTSLGETGAGAIAPNTWYYLELQVKLGDAPDGAVIARLNGTTFLNSSGVDTRNAGTKAVFDSVKLLGSGFSTPFIIDDLYISTGSVCPFQGDHTIASPLLLNDPCDNFTFAPWVTTSGTPTITASGHTGNALSIPALAGIGYDIPAGLQTAKITFGAWVRWTTLPGTLTPYFRWRSDAGVTIHMALEFDSGGNVTFRRGDGTVIGSTGTGTGIVAGTWYFIEATLTLADTDGTFLVKRDGTTILTCTATGISADTKNGGTKTVLDRLQIIGGTMLVDDVYIRNDANFGLT